MDKFHKHRLDCPFSFAPLDVCDCVEKNLRDRIAELEVEREELRAAIFGGHNYDPALRNDNFREMAESLHAAQRGGLTRAEAAEARITELEAALRPFVEIAKDRVADAPEWQDSDSVTVILEIGDLRTALEGEK